MLMLACALREAAQPEIGLREGAQPVLGITALAREQGAWVSAHSGPPRLRPRGLIGHWHRRTHTRSAGDELASLTKTSARRIVVACLATS